MGRAPGASQPGRVDCPSEPRCPPTCPVQPICADASGLSGQGPDAARVFQHRAAVGGFQGGLGRGSGGALGTRLRGFLFAAHRAAGLPWAPWVPLGSPGLPWLPWAPLAPLTPLGSPVGSPGLPLAPPGSSGLSCWLPCSPGSPDPLWAPLGSSGLPGLPWALLGSLGPPCLPWAPPSSPGLPSSQACPQERGSQRLGTED